MKDDTHTIAVTRVFDAPRDLVFRNWVRAEDVAAWFAPDGYTVTRSELDARPGGNWVVEYRSPDGETYREYGEFREVVDPERLVFTLKHRGPRGEDGPDTVVTVGLAEHGTKTEMTFEQSGFGSAAVRDGNSEGWRECFAKLDAHLTHEEKR